MIRTIFLSAALLLAGVARAQSTSELENLLDPARLPYLKHSRHLQFSSFDSTGGNDDRINLRDGETAVLADVEGPGVITRIWVTTDSPDPHFLRHIVLRMFWDDEEHPSVEVPLGDFFGTGFQYAPYISAYVGMSSGGYYSYFPMPFRKRARIEITNETGQHLPMFYYHINVQKLQEPLDEDVAYFHASWNRVLRTPTDENYTILEAEGRGHLVGVNMSMQGYEGNLWYLEGDEMIYVDGESHPSIYGTGTEDYFTSGWYFNQGPFSAPYHGLILKDTERARIAAYRLHTADAIPFEKSLRFTIEHGHGNTEIADYSSTAYWYQIEPHRPFPPLPRASLRTPLRMAVPNGAIEFESDQVRVTGAPAEIEDMRPFGADWSGLQQLRISTDGPDDTFTVSIPAGLDDRYNLDLYFTTGPEYGNAVIKYEDEPLDTLVGYAEQILPGGSIHLESLRAEEGAVTLTFEMIESHPAAEGASVGLDAVVAEPNREFIPEWYVIGPFPNPRSEDGQRLGLHTTFPPDEEIDLDATYSGMEGQQVRWQKMGLDSEGRLQLWGRFEPNDLITTYALTYVHSPDAREVPLLLGADDGVRVLLNDESVFLKEGINISAPDQDRVILSLRPGWNKLMIKLENNYGGYNFYARLLDPEAELTVSADRTK